MPAGARWALGLPAALTLVALILVAGVWAGPGTVRADAPRGTPPSTAELRRSQAEPVAERSEFTLAALSENYQRKQGGAGAGLAHHFLNLICSATDPAGHAGRCPDAPYPDWRWSGRFTLDVLYLTALDFRGPRAVDYRLIEGPLYSLRGRCGGGGLLCGGDLAMVGGVIYHFTTQLAPFFGIVIGAQMDDLLAASGADVVEPLAEYTRDLREEHGALLAALRRGIGLIQARGEMGVMAATLGQLLTPMAVDLREATLRRSLAARLPAATAAEAYARSLRPD